MKSTNNACSAYTCVTKYVDPEYVAPPTVTVNDRALVVDWAHSFRLNGRLQKYVLYTNGYRTYSGFSEQTTVVRETLNKRKSFTQK